MKKNEFDRVQSDISTSEFKDLDRIRQKIADRAEWKKISELDDLLVADYVRRVVRDD